MQKTKTYDNTRFSAEVVKQALEAYATFIKLEDPSKPFAWVTLNVETGPQSWSVDSVPEFLGDYSRPFTKATAQSYITPNKQFHFFVRKMSTELRVSLPTRQAIEEIFNILDLQEERSRLPVIVQPKKPPKPLRVFIGHGRSQQWRDLKDHLHDKHQILVEAYEVGARAGHTIRDILAQMLDSSTFACLVLTGEDETTDGRTLARQNVIHEAGLFQGRLGFSRAIILLEDGTEEFSNVSGVQQIRFSKNNIKETFGEVLATLKREFPGR